MRAVFVFLPIFHMGQYFKPVNITKQEYVCPWCIGGGAKLWEWAVNPGGAIFVLLLRRSSQTGGGDYGGPATQVVELTEQQDLAEVIAKGILREGQDLPLPPESMVGRWAGDEVYLVGDYDDSGHYQRASEFTNISRPLVEAWNAFVELPDYQLRFESCGCDGRPAEV